MMEGKIMFKASPDLGDGVSNCIYSTVDELCVAIREFATGALVENLRFTVRTVRLSDDEYEKLPEL